MKEERNPVIGRFCLVLSLAIALIAIGLVIFFDHFSLSGSANGRASLSPGGGLVSVLLGASFLALAQNANGHRAGMPYQHNRPCPDYPAAGASRRIA